MAFELKKDESISHGLRRLAEKELRRAHKNLADSGEATDQTIHAARKSIKKVRAVVQLIEDAVGVTMKKPRKRLRRVSRTLSSMRDADAMVKALGKLRNANPRAFSEHTFARVKRRLSSDKATLRQTAHEVGLDGADGRIRRLRKDVKDWHVDGVKSLRAGIREAHRRGRQALEIARKKQTESDFHQWRKDLKTLWYLLRLVEGAGRAVKRDVEVLHRAELQLGDAHDLSLLHHSLSWDAELFRTEFDRFRVSLTVGQMQSEWRAEAIRATRRIYMQKSGSFAKAIMRQWRAAKRRHEARASRTSRHASAA